MMGHRPKGGNRNLGPALRFRAAPDAPSPRAGGAPVHRTSLPAGRKL